MNLSLQGKSGYQRTMHLHMTPYCTVYLFIYFIYIFHPGKRPHRSSNFRTHLLNDNNLVTNYPAMFSLSLFRKQSEHTPKHTNTQQQQQNTITGTKLT